MSSEAISSEENEVIVRRFLEEVVKEKNLNVVDELIATECITHIPAIEVYEISGRDGVKNFIGQFHTVFRNFALYIDNLVAKDNNHVVTLWRGEADHLGRFEADELEVPIEPTGAHVEMWVTSVFRISDREVAEAWITMLTRTSGDEMEDDWSVMSPEDWTEPLGPGDGLVPGEEYFRKRRKPIWCRPFERCC